MRSSLLAFALLLPLAPAAQADVLEMPESTPSAATEKPTKGMTMNAVLATFGAPSTRHRPVGGSSAQQPPITRWDYPGFSVFFEHDHVVDAVMPGRPPALQHTEELR